MIHSTLTYSFMSTFNKDLFLYLCLSLCSIGAVNAQNGQIKGQLQDDQSEPVIYSNVSLYQTVDSTLVKVETSDDAGFFQIQGISNGNYFLKASYVGLQDIVKTNLSIKNDDMIDLGLLKFTTAGTELNEVTVTAKRALVEVKPDRTVFNVQGTINSVGEEAISLLKKAPGVTVDNNDNISVLGRTGVRIFVDGKPLPLSGDDLSAYLRNLPAEQIDKIDIITNPGAKYEAEGNAGIIDIRLKRDKNIGANGSISSSFSQGRHSRYNISGTGNYRNKKMNVFGNAGFGNTTGYNDMIFRGTQNGIFLDETNDAIFSDDNINYRVGVDFFLNEKQTIGFLIGGSNNVGDVESFNQIIISQQATQNSIDSVLIAENSQEFKRNSNSFNINYRYDITKEKNLNIDLDYGKFSNVYERFSPNRYYETQSREKLLTEAINTITPETIIDIYTAKLDYEQPLAGGQLGLGLKFSQVVSDNAFLFFDQLGNAQVQNNQRSNIFEYTEKVYAGYASYNRPINKAWSFSSGLRLEQTDALGILTPFDVALIQPPVEQNYLSLFPNVGLTWTPKQMHSFNLALGRRINRPDYNVLNPFEDRISELSSVKGSPNLQAEIVNNVELGYTLMYMYNFKLAYSKTSNQITRLIGPDENDPRAGFITWANLAEQTVFSANISAPMQFSEKWNAFFNISSSLTDNQADYGDGKIVDVQAFTYTFYTQQTFTLPSNFNAEVSGYYSGPGVWGGVFKYDPSWALNLGLQKKFFKDQLNVKLAVNDIFFQSYWTGIASYNGRVSYGEGRNDNRRVSLSASYTFGNQNVKSRKRKTGIEDESKRVGN